MAPGIILIILGAVFAFALDIDSPWLHTHVFGVILMLGGLAFCWRARVRRKVVVTRETEHHGDTADAEERTVTEQRFE